MSQETQQHIKNEAPDREPLDPASTNGELDPSQVLSPSDEWIPNDHRARERHKWQAQVEVELEEGLRPGEKDGPHRVRETHHRKITVITEDLSTGGFAFVHKGFIHPGTVVKVRFEMLPNQPVYLGTVRHCINIGGMKHRVGVQFHSHPGKTG
ncbi:MAG: PilZ domain-containing protein [Planctomycetota bacterium]|jgi:hypothetical protein